jgi:hypothetical protein
MPEMSDKYRERIFKRILAYTIPMTYVTSFGSTLSILASAVER